MSVYLIHFQRRYRHAGHYLGFALDVPARLWHHRQGTGANLVRVVNREGIDWVCARVWPDGDRTLERRLKNHSSTRYCPVCRGEVLVCWDCHRLYRRRWWYERHCRTHHLAAEAA